MRRLHIAWALAPVIALVASGCATRKYVRTEVQAAESRTGERITEVETQVEEAQTGIGSLEAELDEQESRLAEASGTARDALERAIAAGELAEGKFLFETMLSDESVVFEFDTADLSAAGREALDAFAAEIRSRNENVFIEIQGHTDHTGSEAYNLRLGEQRAEAVRRYLSREHGFALHRMSVISYGESAAVADNSTREGRARNRRVALVVLQ